MRAIRGFTASLSLSPGAATQAATAARERHRARYALVITQVAISLMLLTASGLLARTVWRLRSVDQVAYVRFASVYKEFRDVAEFVDEISALGKPKKP